MARPTAPPTSARFSPGFGHCRHCLRLRDRGFNLNATALGAAAHPQLERFSGSGWGAAHAFIAVGIIAILLATFRFMRKGWLLDDQAVHSPGILPDLALGVILALMLVAVSAYLLLTRSSAP